MLAEILCIVGAKCFLELMKQAYKVARYQQNISETITRLRVDFSNKEEIPQLQWPRY